MRDFGWWIYGLSSLATQGSGTFAPSLYRLRSDHQYADPSQDLKMADTRSPWSKLPNMTCTRVVYLDEATEDCIRVHLEEKDLNESPAYDCLSYTWDDPLYHGLTPAKYVKRTSRDEVVPIWCNGIRWQITENLQRALIRLARGSSDAPDDAFRRPECIWVDALSINQKDKAEKGEQVKMMTRIFGQARRVIVWLGSTDVYMETAMAIIDGLASVPEPRYREAKLPTTIQDEDLCEALGIEYIPEYEWLEYITFLKRTWFTRVWMIQEAFMAQEIVVLCGPDILSWKKLMQCARLLRETKLEDMLMELLAGRRQDKSTRIIANELTNLYSFGAMKRQQTTLRTGKVLSYSKFFNATNPRDHVFAVQSLHSNQSACRVLEDYVVGVEAVFTAASWIVLSETNDLRLLSMIEDRRFRSTPRLPSWVPDLHARPVMFPIAADLWATASGRRWCASRGIPFIAPHSTGNTKFLGKSVKAREAPTWLPIQGLRIDSVATLSVSGEEMEREHRVPELLGFLKKVLDTDDSQGSQGSKTQNEALVASVSVPSPTEAFWRALIMDTFKDAPATALARALFPMHISRIISELEFAVRQTRANAGNLDAGDTECQTRLSSLLSQTKELVDELSVRTARQSTPTDIEVAFKEVPDLPASSHGGIIPSWPAIQAQIDEYDRDGGGGDHFSSERHEAAQAIWRAFSSANTGRRLFRTARWNYVGLGPESMTDRDSLWILAGADVPMVLRPADGVQGGLQDAPEKKFELVGEAYILGLMEGQVTSSDDVGLEKICLV